VTILTVRGVPLKEKARERILGCGDLPTLVRWLALAPTAADGEALLALEGGAGETVPAAPDDEELA
jgi:hypothetical protein